MLLLFPLSHVAAEPGHKPIYFGRFQSLTTWGLQLEHCCCWTGFAAKLVVLLNWCCCCSHSPTLLLNWGCWLTGVAAKLVLLLYPCCCWNVITAISCRWLNLLKLGFFVTCAVKQVSLLYCCCFWRFCGRQYVLLLNWCWCQTVVAA